VDKLFQLRNGEVAEGVSTDGKSHSVVRIVNITAATAQPDAMKKMDDAVRASMTEDILSQYRSALQRKYDVEINDGIIDSLFDELNVRG